jgi:hypothetical protein
MTKHEREEAIKSFQRMYVSNHINAFELKERLEWVYSQGLIE